MQGESKNILSTSVDITAVRAYFEWNFTQLLTDSLFLTFI